MRVIIPDNQGADTFSDNVSSVLREMGHEVISPPPRPGGRRWGQLSDRLRAKAGRPLPTFADRWLLEAVRSCRAELLLALTQAVDPRVLAEAKRCGVRRCVAWWGDTPANFTEMGLLTDEWDLICLKDPEGVAKFRRVGLNAMLLHEAMNPRWHRRIATRSNDEIVVAGNYYGLRQFLVNRLLARGLPVVLYGSAMPRWTLPALRPHHTGRYLVREEKSRVFGAALACLNSTAFSEGNSLNCRAFEIAGTGGLQLMERRPVVAECFEPDREILLYDSIDELVGHLERAKADPGGLEAIREAGHRRAVAHHTYQHRLGTMFRAIGFT